MAISSTVAGDRFASVATELRADSEVADDPRGSFSWEPVGAAAPSTRHPRKHVGGAGGRLDLTRCITNGFFCEAKRRSAEVSDTKMLHTSPKQWQLPMPPLTKELAPGPWLR